MTYGDGVADIDVAALIAFHKGHGRQAALTAVVPPGRYGAVVLDGDAVQSFVEKRPGDNSFINGGYFVLEPAVLDRIAGDQTPWEVGRCRNLPETASCAPTAILGSLAAVGYVAGQDAARGALAAGARAVEDVAVTPSEAAPRCRFCRHALNHVFADLDVRPLFNRNLRPEEGDW